ncbi:kinase domain protein, partial [Opisthorchis viverrini]
MQQLLYLANPSIYAEGKDVWSIQSPVPSFSVEKDLEISFVAALQIALGRMGFRVAPLNRWALSDRVVFYTPDHDTKIAGLYDLQHTIGRGHYAVVKLARHVFTGEKVAVKVIDKTKLDDVAQDHLFQEVVCMKLVQHPNVVRLYEVIDTPAKLYLILELGDGGDLYDYITKQGCGLHEKVAKRYFRQIVTAIAYCHKLHVVHRDLKPENVVFFEKLGVVKLTDFGFSNRFTPGMHLDTACGSLAYSAPEILLGDPYDAPKVDIWSLGVILYMLVCGRLPFQEVTDSETVTKIMDCDYIIPDYLSPECKRLISRLLVREPEKRAHLDDVLLADWLKPCESDELPIEMFSVPLVSRECLSFEDHMEILSKMSEGQLATVEEIQSTLDRNEYNHIAATYYLLAERKLKRNYVEQYKVLMRQAQMSEKLQRQQQQQLQENSCPPEKSWVAQYNEMSGKSVNTNSAVLTGTRVVSSVNQTANQTPAQPTEERIRRFSMILEDEEEEEEEDHRSPMISTFRQYLAEEYERAGLVDNVTADNKVLESCLSETLMEEEEEEELMTVANLACVRSDLLAEQAGNTATLGFNSFSDHLSNAPALTRPCSRTSGSGLEASDGAESDASLSNWSTGGSTAIGSAPTARVLHPVELRRKSHYRRGAIHHRPLISVKSSPQLLKHITEEDWNGSIGGLDKDGTFASNKLDKYNRLPRSETHSPTHQISTPQRCALTRSPHRGFSPTHRVDNWCRSAPLLYGAESSSVSDTWSPGSGVAPNGTTLSSINGALLSQAGPTGLREHCTPIREEEDEVLRSGEVNHPVPYSKTIEPSYNRRRRSESSDVRTRSAALPNSDVIRTLDSESIYALNQSAMNPSSSCVDRTMPISQLTNSNFSLSSLATSLRGSRHMLDVVRGTFELQYHYGRRTGGSVAGGSSGGYPSGRASASASVRSLTAISESLPISTGLSSDLPINSSRKTAHFRSGLSYDPSLTKGNTAGRRAIAARRSAALNVSGPLFSGHRSLHHNTDPSDHLCMTSEMMHGYDVEREQRHPNDGPLPLRNSPTAEWTNVHSTESSLECRQASSTVRGLQVLRPNGLHFSSPTSGSHTRSGLTSAGLCGLRPQSASGATIHPLGSQFKIGLSPFISSIPASMVGFDKDGDLNLIDRNTNRTLSASGDQGQQRQ